MTITPQNSQDLMNKDEALSLIHEIKNDVNSIRQKLILLKTKDNPCESPEQLPGKDDE